MKVALYIEDGLEQIVLTPETEAEEDIIGKLTDGSRDLSVKKGDFYHCTGGWVRHADPARSESTMIVLRQKPAPQPDCDGAQS